MFARFFVDRPVLATVLSIVIVFLGGLGMASLPIAQFPDVAPPTVYVSIAYPGASANVLTDSVLVPLEQFAEGSRTPASKSVVVTLCKAVGVEKKKSDDD